MQMRGIIRLLTYCFILVFGCFATAYAAPTCTNTYTACVTGYNLSSGTCVASTYTISYNLNNGTQASSGVPTSYKYGTGATINGVPTRSEYTFAGWCTDSGLTSCSISQSISTTATGNKTFYATWTQCTACSAGTGANCSMSVVDNACTYKTSCKAGYYNLQNNGEYNPSCSACGTGTYTTEGNTETSCSECTHKPSNSSYTGSATTDNCSWACNTGYYKEGDKCSSVGNGYYSPDKDNTRYDCKIEAGSDYSNSDGTFGSINDCYKTCSVYESEGQTYSPVNPTAHYSNDCSYDQSCTTKCTDVKNTDSTSCDDRACSVTGGSCYYSGSTKTCQGNYTNDSCSSSGDSCTGCSAWGVCTGGTRVITCPGGTYWNGTSCVTCSADSYCPGFANISENSLSNGYGQNSCGNDYQYSDSGSQSYASCYKNVTRGCIEEDGATPLNCAGATWGTCTCDGSTYKKYSDGSIVGVTENEICVKPLISVTASADHYVSGTTCPACNTLGGGLYAHSVGTTAGPEQCYASVPDGKYLKSSTDTMFTLCVPGTVKTGHTLYYSEVSSCDACACGTYQPSTGQTSCKTTDAGYYATGTGNTTQTAAGVGKWAAAGSCSSTACASGLTTIGYGAGADESGDCGNIYHVGDGKIYLRSERKTIPSLNFDLNNDGEADLYGNMSSTAHKMSAGTEDSLKIKIGSTIYYVHDDSAN